MAALQQRIIVFRNKRDIEILRRTNLSLKYFWYDTRTQLFISEILMTFWLSLNLKLRRMTLITKKFEKRGL